MLQMMSKAQRLCTLCCVCLAGRGTSNSYETSLGIYHPSVLLGRVSPSLSLPFKRYNYVYHFVV